MSLVRRQAENPVVLDVPLVQGDWSRSVPVTAHLRGQWLDRIGDNGVFRPCGCPNDTTVFDHSYCAYKEKQLLPWRGGRGFLPVAPAT
jgi:hypothetical protein